MDTLSSSQSSKIYKMDDSLKSELSQLLQSLDRNKKISENLETLHNISENYLHRIPIHAIDFYLLRHIFPEIKEYLDNTFEEIIAVVQDRCTIDKLKELLQASVQLLTVCGQTLDYLKTFEKIDVSNVNTVPVLTLDILLTTFKHCKDSNTLYGDYFQSARELLTVLFKTAQNLQSLYLLIMSNKINFNEDVDVLVKALDKMVLVGEILPDMNTKAMVDQWKGYAQLIQKNSDNLKNCLQLALPLGCLVKQIQNNLNSVTDLDAASEENFRSCTNTLKASNFLLNIIMKLCESFKDVSNFPYEEIISLLIILNGYSTPYLHWKKYSAKLIDSIQNYVTTSSEVLLGLFIVDYKFLQCYFKNINNYIEKRPKKLGFLFFTLSLMKKNITYKGPNDNKKLIGYKLLKVIFQTVHLYHAEFMYNLITPAFVEIGQSRRFTNLYEILLNVVAATAINLTDEQYRSFEKILMQNVLQSNFWKAILAIDIWTVLDRYGTDELTFQHIHYIIGAINNLEIKNYKSPEIIFLNELLKRLYSLLSNSYKLKLLEIYQLDQNLDIYIIIGLQQLPDPDATKKIILYTLKKTNDRLKNVKTQRITLKDWKNMCIELTCIRSLKFEPTEMNTIAEVIMNIWSLNFSHNVLKSNKTFQYFIHCLVESSIGFVVYFRASSLLNALSQIKFHMESGVPFQLSTLKLLQQLSTKQIEQCSELGQITQTLSDLFRVLLMSENEIVKEKGFKIFNQFIHITKHEDVIVKTVKNDHKLQASVSKYIQNIIEHDKHISVEDYYKMQESIRFKHVCCSTNREKFVDEPQKKKIKTMIDINVDLILERLQSDADTIVEHFNRNEINSINMIKLSSIAQKIQSICSER